MTNYNGNPIKRKKPCIIKECPLFNAVECNYVGNKNADIVYCYDSPFTFPTRGRMAPELSNIASIALNAGVNMSEAMIITATRCNVSKTELNMKQKMSALALCRPKLEMVLLHAKPKLIVCAGDLSLRQITKRPGIKKQRGRFIWSEEFNCWTLPMFGPEYIRDHPSMTKTVSDDFLLIKRLIKNRYKPREAKPNVSYKSANSIRFLLDNKKISHVAIDTEGQGLNCIDKNYLMIGYSVAWAKGNGVFIRLHEECSEPKSDFSFFWKRRNPTTKKITEVPVHVRKVSDYRRRLSELKELLESSSIRKWMMNGNFDRHAIDSCYKREDIPCPMIKAYTMDIQAAAHVIDENLYRMASLESLQRSFTNYYTDYNHEFSQSYDKSDMLSVKEKDLVRYAVADSDVTFRVASNVISVLSSAGNRRQAKYVSNFVQPILSGLLYELERNGTYLDREQIVAEEAKLKSIIKHTHDEAVTLIPERVLSRIDPNKLVLTRPDLIRTVLFSNYGYGLKPIKFTSSNLPSVDKESRLLLSTKKIKSKCKKFIELCDQFVEMNTMLSRYMTGMQKHIKSDGKIHSRFSLTATVTGRVASSDPNVMNMPKRGKLAKIFRRLITASPGYVLMAADEGQSELRWLAELSDDPEMKRVFANNEDIHTNTAQDLSVKPLEDLSAEELSIARRKAKSTNFGLAYLMTVGGFIRYAKLNYGIEVSEKDAKIWIDSWFNRYKGVKRYHNRMISFCKKNLYVESVFGRRRRLPEILSKNSKISSSAERMAVNHPIQGPSSDVVLIAGNEMYKENQNNRICRPILFIHDELVFEVMEDADLIVYAKRLKYHMEHPPTEKYFGYKMKTPLIADVKIGKNLAEMTKVT